MYFAFPAKTSRNTLYQKDSWFVVVEDIINCLAGIGECTLINSLSIDNPVFFEDKIKETCNFINQNGFFSDDSLQMYPGIRFGFETAFNDLKNGGRRLIFNNQFYYGNQFIPINGLVWMADFQQMKNQVKEKISAGYNCIKIKIGAFDFFEEIYFLKNLRKEFGNEFLLRLDANGAFSSDEAVEKLKYLSDLNIHSIEQPVKPGQADLMNHLCMLNIVPVALDEELIGTFGIQNKRKLLADIRPQYIVLKPSLLGGFIESQEWIDLAEELSISWWVTSALESNIGLNAIAQWTAGFNPSIHQGLGTGNIYTNNFTSPLVVNQGEIGYNPDVRWDLSTIFV